MYQKAYGIIKTLAPLHVGSTAGEETGNLLNEKNDRPQRMKDQTSVPTTSTNRSATFSPPA